MILFKGKNLFQKSFWLSDPFIFGNLIASFLILIILILFIFFKLSPNSNQVAVHYNVLIGVDVVKSGWALYGLPLISLLVLLYNFALGRKFHEIEPLASHLLAIVSTIVGVIMLIAVMALYYFL